MPPPLSVGCLLAVQSLELCRSKDIALPMYCNILQFLYIGIVLLSYSSSIPRIYQTSAITQRYLWDLVQINERAAVEIDVNMDGRKSKGRTNAFSLCLFGTHFCLLFILFSLYLFPSSLSKLCQIGAIDAQIREHCSAAAKHWLVGAVVSLAFPQQRLWFGFFSPIKKLPSRQVGDFSLSHLTYDG